MQWSVRVDRTQKPVIWFTDDPAQRPANNTAGDPTTYAATFVDATHLKLDRPYEGRTGIHGWQMSVYGVAGYGQQPFVLGILGLAFDFAGKAVADTDPATSALAHSYNVAAANWLNTFGYWPSQKAMYYFSGFVNCRPPIADNNTVCTAGNNASQARTLNAESLRTVMGAYAYTGSTAFKNFGDTLYSAMFSKPGTGGPIRTANMCPI